MPAEGSTSQPLRQETRNRGGGGTFLGWMLVTIVAIAALWVLDGTRVGAQEPSGNRRPRIAVEKRNDATGDGRFSRDEAAARPGADVTFMVNITNIGKVSVRIRRVSDSYGTTTIEVCRKLLGRRLRPGRAVACTFTIEDYAPTQFDSRANTVGVSVRATRGNRSAAAAAISTVTTLGSPTDVRGQRARRDGRREGNLAATGPSTAPRWALALGLLATGSELLALARRRARKHAPQRTH